MISQLFERSSVALILDKNIVRGIRHLLRPRCPPAISGGIGPVRVYPLKGAVRGARPHVAQEGDETVTPLSANGDTPAPIAVIFNVLRVITPLFHTRPRMVLAAVPLNQCGLPRGQATATKAFAVSQVAAPYFAHSPTGASANPPDVFLLGGTMEHGPTSDASAAEVDKVSARGTGLAPELKGHDGCNIADWQRESKQWQQADSAKMKDKLEVAACRRLAAP